MKKEVVLVFQRNEVLGKVKTRLAAGVGEEQAMEIYRYLLNKTYLALKEITVPVTTYFSESIQLRTNKCKWGEIWVSE